MQKLLMSGTHDGGGTSVSLSAAEYAGNSFRDTDWGGKTGTSNNHSDAWFVGVSPNLVVGAWVGGEYRSIHFRTGALGQGARTALPICGYFIHSVMEDPAFQKYHAKFQTPNDESITKDMYDCSPYYAPARNDSSSLHRDSVMVTDEEIVLDENGNPITTPSQGTTLGKEKTETGTDKKHKTEETVNFDNL